MIHYIDGEKANPKTIFYHAVNQDGTDLQQDDVQNLTLFVYETETGDAMTDPQGEDKDVTVCVFDTLQPWSIDRLGYNVAVDVSGTYLMDAEKTYRVEVRITPPDDGMPYYLDHVEIRTAETYSANSGT